MKRCAMSILLAALLMSGAVWAEAEPQTAAVPSLPAVDRSVPPELTGPAPNLTLPEVAERRLDNGIPVYIAVRTKLPVEEICFVFPEAVSKNEPSGKYGLSTAVLNLMLNGAGERDSFAFEKQADLLGASIDNEESLDRLALTVFCPAKHLPETVDLAADAIMSPSFAQPELEKYQKDFQAYYSLVRTAPRALHGLALTRLLYGESSRYGTFSGGTPRQVAAITRQDLADYHAKYFTPDKMFICCCGSAEPDAVMEILNKRLGRWKPVRNTDLDVGAQKAAPASSLKSEPRFIPPGVEKSALMDGRIFVVDYAGAHQSNISLGCLGITARDPERLTVEAMNEVLGGGLSSRLNQNLREDRGFTYSASSKFCTWTDHGYFQAQTAVQTDKTIPAVREMLKEIDSMHQPVPAADLQRTLNYLAYRLPRKFASNRRINDYVTRKVLYGYPQDYADTYVSKMLKLTPDDIKRAADRTLDTGKMILVIVGDAKALEPQFKEAGWRAQVMTVDDILEP